VLLRLAQLVVVAAFAGCQGGEPHASPPEPAPQATVKPASLTPGERIVVDGIGVELLENGELRLIGTDSWGKPLDTTYENIGFFRDALPVLERSLTPKQIASLRALVASQTPP
jgi:hypothetical protein